MNMTLPLLFGYDILAVLFGFIVLALAYFWNQKPPKNFPPGPWGYPIIGHLPMLGTQGHKEIIKWKAKYGPIMGVNFASEWAVIISDFKLIKEAYYDLKFAGRPKIPERRLVEGVTITNEDTGIVFREGKRWVELRRFTLRHLRDFGFGTSSAQNIFQDDIQETIEILKKTAGTSIDASRMFTHAIVNVLWTQIAGERFSQDDPKLTELVKIVTGNIGQNNLGQLISAFFPLVGKYGPDFLTQRSKMEKPIKATLNFMAPVVEAYLKSHVPGHPKSLIDAYIDEQKNCTDPESVFNLDNKLTLIFTISDLFLAGSETTATTISWIFLYLARYQYVQNKVFEEVNRVVGQYRIPQMTDRPDMPYTESVINEVMRVNTFSPLLFHSTMEPVDFHGYHFPKGTMVFANLYDAHNQVDIWEDPANFRPERFIKNGKFERHEALVAFSLGKRVCIGEKLALEELFLFVSSMIQVFHITCDPTKPPPPFEPAKMMLNIPQHHELVFNLRKYD